MMIKVIGVIADFVEHDNTTILKTPFYRVRETYLNYLQKHLKNNQIVVFIPYLQDKIDEYVKLCNGVLLVGGDDLPPETYRETKLFNNVNDNKTRYKFELEFIKKYIQTNKPILGICAGMQSINVALGGSLYQDIYKQTKTKINHSQKEEFSKPTHKASIEKRSKLFELVKTTEISTNSMHHQAVKELGKDLIISAKAEDDNIEAIELKNHKFCIGLQWHPEFGSCYGDEAICEGLCSCL